MKLNDPVSVIGAFNAYRESVIPKDAPPFQVEECKRAFFAGAFCMLTAVSYATEKLADDDVGEYLRALHAECDAFFKSRASGERTTRAVRRGKEPQVETHTNFVEPQNFNIRNPEMEQLMQQFARDIRKMIGRRMPPEWGFTLMLFNFNKPDMPKTGSMFYISTANRDDMVEVMKEFINRNIQ